MIPTASSIPCSSRARSVTSGSRPRRCPCSTRSYPLYEIGGDRAVLVLPMLGAVLRALAARARRDGSARAPDGSRSGRWACDTGCGVRTRRSGSTRWASVRALGNRGARRRHPRAPRRLAWRVLGAGLLFGAAAVMRTEALVYFAVTTARRARRVAGTRPSTPAGSRCRCLRHGGRVLRAGREPSARDRLDRQLACGRGGRRRRGSRRPRRRSVTASTEPRPRPRGSTDSTRRSTGSSARSSCCWSAPVRGAWRGRRRAAPLGVAAFVGAAPAVLDAILQRARVTFPAFSPHHRSRPRASCSRWGRRDLRLPTLVACLALPLVWATQYSDSMRPSGVGRYALASGVLLAVVTVVVLAGPACRAGAACGPPVR